MTDTPFEIKLYTQRELLINGVSAYAPSLDRVDPKKGYTMDNVKVVVDNFNKLKSSNTIADAYIIARNFVNTYKQRHRLQL